MRTQTRIFGWRRRRVARGTAVLLGLGLWATVLLAPQALGAMVFGSVGAGECETWADAVLSHPGCIFAEEFATSWEPTDPHDPNLGVRCDRLSCNTDCAHDVGISPWSEGGGLFIEIGCACPGGRGSDGCALAAFANWNPLGPGGWSVQFTGYMCLGDCAQDENCAVATFGAAPGSGPGTKIGCRCQ